MKFVIRKVIAKEWDWENRTYSNYEDKIFLKPYNYTEALKKISCIYDDMENHYNWLNNLEDLIICKWDIRVMLVPVSEDFKGKTNWINTKNFLKYKG